MIKKPLHRALARISERYGPVLLLHFGSRPVLLVSSPSAAEECLHKNDIIFANRPHLMAGQYLGYNYTSLAWSSYGDHWRNLRKISALEILSTNRLQMLHGIRVDELKSMIRALHSASLAKEPVNMKKTLFEMLLNVMMRMIGGKRYYGENVEDIEEAERFREIVTETMRFGSSNIGDFLPVARRLKLGSVEQSLKKLQAKRDIYIRDLIRDCRTKMDRNDGDSGVAGGERRKSLIDVLLTLQKEEPDYYKDEIIGSLMLVLLAAGTDTSAGTMEWALSAMLNNPEILKKAQTEIDKCVGNDRLLDESDVLNLPYLRCIINETLRMFPAGPLLIPHESSEATTVGGYRVPKGTMLLVNVWAIQNDPKVWDEPRKFKPERFEGLEGTRDGYKLMPFGSGRRGCPGEGLAVRIVGATLGSIIQCFDWERNGDELVDMTEGLGLTMPKAQPLIAKCKPRSPLLNLLSQI